jgi:sulfocyanin SoxE-like protein
MRLSRYFPHPALVALLVTTPLAAQSPGGAKPAAWVAADTAARTAAITLEVTAPPGSPSALLNGYREGGVQIVVPLRWTVTWDWRSADSAGKHSLVVMAEREKLPTEGGRPAFTNAMSRNVTTGLAAGQSDRTTFEAEEAGWYWLLCGVPGHAIAGEWIGLRVDAEATTAMVKEKRE